MTGAKHTAASRQAREVELDQFVKTSIRLCMDRRYVPTRYIEMFAHCTATKMIERLVVSGDMQSGFLKMHELGLLDWTAEAAAAEQFADLFTVSIQEAAKFRLEHVRASKPGRR